MTALGAMLHREARIRATNFAFLFWDLLYPLFYLLVFGVGVNASLGGGGLQPGISYNAFFLAGVLGIASFGIANNSAWSFFLDRDNGIFYEMLTYPMRRSDYLLGKVFLNIAVAVVQAAITVAIGARLLGIAIRWERWPLLLAGVVVGAAAWFFLYSVFALRIRRNDTFNSVNSIFYFVFLFASSLFYPLASLPRWFRMAALANPITWQVDLLRYATVGLGPPAQIAWEAAAFLVFAAVCFAAAVHSLAQQG
ncbi:MAG: ABC transporter permease [Terriglobales bacterium]